MTRTDLPLVVAVASVTFALMGDPLADYAAIGAVLLAGIVIVLEGSNDA